MGGFVATTLQCQAQCRNSTDYNFPERSAIGELLAKGPVMSCEVWLCIHLVSKDFHIYNSHRCKSLASNHTKMKLTNITPLQLFLVNLVSVSYSSGKKLPAFSFDYVYVWTSL